MIRRSIITIAMIFALPVFLFAQKSKVIAVFHLIETEKYKEAKDLIEEAKTEEKTKDWPRTWYARGVLAQTAYEKGIKENDKKKYELYPDQPYVAYESFEKALNLDNRKRYNETLAPHYVKLANDFLKMAEKLFRNGEFEESLRAYEKALEINESDIITVETAPELIYNTALAAYKSEEKEKAVEYLEKLNKVDYSSQVPLLLYNIYIENADTSSAKEVLNQGVEQYEDNEKLVLLLADLLYNNEEIEKAISVLDSAEKRNPENYIFPYTQGLIFQKNEKYDLAVKSYQEALELKPDDPEILESIGTAWYNTGVDIEENARSIRSNALFLQEKEKAAESFRSALEYFERAYQENPEDNEIITRLEQLYDVLDMESSISQD